MKPIYLTLPLALVLGACSTTTISGIGFPEPTVLTGHVQSIDEESFVLKDATGKIEIDTEETSFAGKLTVGDKVTVKGVLDEDDSVGKDHIVAEEFDAYSVILPSGEEVMLVPYKSK
jgi:calcineurin-like phosphoesterase family protein